MNKDKKDEDKQTKRLNFRLSENELNKIKFNASYFGISAPRYLKKLGMKQEVIQPKVPYQVVEYVLFQVSKIGNNLNQLTHIANENHAIEDINEINNLRKAVNELCQQLK